VKITLINGSPKKENSTSGAILQALRSRIDRISERAGFTLCNVAQQGAAEAMDALAGSDALVFAFPLYVDGIPSHLLRLLDEKRGSIADAARGAIVYAIVNNGFYEGKQNALALEMMSHFCDDAGLVWGQGLGVGGGMIPRRWLGHGPLKNLGRALDVLAKNIVGGKSAEDCCFNPNFPKWLYKLAGETGWRVKAWKNGLTGKRLRARP
jgi:multimeric flavodoxin WrbA